MNYRFGDSPLGFGGKTIYVIWRKIWGKDDNAVCGQPKTQFESQNSN